MLKKLLNVTGLSRVKPESFPTQRDFDDGIVRIPTSAEIHEAEERDWDLLDPDMQQEVVGYLRAELPVELLSEVKKAHDEHGVKWMDYMHANWHDEDRMFYSFHFSEGMGIRNLLRQIIKDGDLPGSPEQKNWDNFYVPGLLRAAGCQ